MRHRLQLGVLMFAWLLATGSQWDIVQAIGWGRMIVKYSQTMPLTQALLLTFDAKSLCAVCETVGVAKKKQGETPAAEGKFPGKLLCVFPSEPGRLTSPVATFVRRGTDKTNPGGEDRRTPPVPPPRSVV